MRLLLLLVAAVIAVFAGVAALQLSTPPAAPGATATAQSSQSVNTVDVLVARQPIPVGAVITSAMFDRQPWPENLVLEGFIVAGTPAANIVGKITRAPFQAREPLITTKLANSTDSGFLAASLPAGSRAVTIATDAVSGVAGFVYPGDRIDLLLTHNIPRNLKSAEAASSPNGMPAAAAGGDMAAYTEVLAANIPVLAVNIREPSSGAAMADGVTGAMAGGSALSSTAPSSMTLQVSDTQAEKIRLAEKVGTLSVALRSVADRDNTLVSQPADLLSLTQLDVDSGNSPVGDTLKVIRGGDLNGSAPAPAYHPGGFR